MGGGSWVQGWGSPGCLGPLRMGVTGCCGADTDAWGLGLGVPDAWVHGWEGVLDVRVHGWGSPGHLGPWVGVPDAWVPSGWGLSGAVGPTWVPGSMGGGLLDTWNHGWRVHGWGSRMPGSPQDRGYWVLWGQPGCLGPWVGVPDARVPLGWGLVGAVGLTRMPGALGGGLGCLGPWVGVSWTPETMGGGS